MRSQSNYYPGKLLRFYCPCGKLKKTNGECCRQIKPYTNDPEVVREMLAILAQKQASMTRDKAPEPA